MEEVALRRRYSLVPLQVALIFLAQGKPEIKAKAICELFSGDEFLNPSPAGINKRQYGQGPQDLENVEDRLRDTMMTHKQLRQIISIFVNISLKLLPVYASDFPPQDKRSYSKFVV